MINIKTMYQENLRQRVGTIKGYKYHPEGKYWSFPNTDGTLEKILKVFEGEKIHSDPVLQNVIARDKVLKQSHSINQDFQDLRRELLLRKFNKERVI